MKKAVSIYSIIIGISMISMWFFFFLSNSIPELETEPVRISMHILAEIITAFLLISSGIGLLKHQDWASKLNLFALGMLIYTLIQSPGYFLETKEYEMVAMFAVMLIFAVFFALKLTFIRRIRK